MSGTVLILGGSGRFGRHATQAFTQAGWQVRQFDRKRDLLDTAARGADVIVAGWNPSYEHWAAEVPRLHAAIRAAALAHDALVILPGNVYVFGPEGDTRWTETSPHRATNPLGRIRAGMEAAYRAEGVRTLVLRAGDFIDTRASGNWFDMIMLPKVAKGRLTYPGNPDLPHAWAFLPDLARAAVLLADRRDSLNRFEDVPFPGHTLSGHQLAEALSRSNGHPVRARRMAWWPLRLFWPFKPVIKHLFEMRYLWNTPHSLDGARLQALLPGFAQTPLETALRAAQSEREVDPDQPMPARAQVSAV